MNEDRLNAKVNKLAESNSGRNCKNWNFRVKMSFEEANISEKDSRNNGHYLRNIYFQTFMTNSNQTGKVMWKEIFHEMVTEVVPVYLVPTVSCPRGQDTTWYLVPGDTLPRGRTPPPPGLSCPREQDTVGTVCCPPNPIHLSFNITWRVNSPHPCP